MLELDGHRVMLRRPSTSPSASSPKRRSRERGRYRGLVESQREIVLRFDASGRVSFANDAYCATYGLRREDVEGKAFWPLVHPDDVARLRTAIGAHDGSALSRRGRGPLAHRVRLALVRWEASAIRDRRARCSKGKPRAAT
jgi:PAS domain S-box-containing protein